MRNPRRRDLWCWGSNGEYALGDGTDDDSSVPVQIGASHLWRSVSAGVAHSCAIDVDGAVWCWGGNEFGQVGNGGDVPIPLPELIDVGPWATVDATLLNTCAIQMDRSLWCWGERFEGGFHPEPAVRETQPTRVGAATDWASVSGDYWFRCGTRHDGTLWCWGLGGYLGNDEEGGDEFAEPTQVGTGDQWRRVENGRFHSCATQLDWSMWCWGANNEGQLGLGHTGDVNVPALVDDSVRWVDFSLGAETTIGISTP